MIKYIVTDIKKLYVFTFLVVFSTCLAFSFDSSARNLLLVGFMALASLSIVFYRQVQKSDFLLLLFVFCLFFFPVFAHDFETRWSTVIYSCLFCMSFIAFVRAFHVAQFSQLDFLNTLRFLLYAYCIVLIIQQISVIVGLPPINLRNYNPAEPFKLNALGAEPSWSARIMALLFYCYITVKEYVLNRQYNFKENIKEDKWIWFAFLWSIITMISGTAMIFLAFVLLKFIRIKKVLSIIPLFFILFVVAESSHFEPYERMKNTTLATLTLDEQKIVEADHSASF